jgi:hypothetical protein
MALLDSLAMRIFVALWAYRERHDEGDYGGGEEDGGIMRPI